MNYLMSDIALKENILKGCYLSLGKGTKTCQLLRRSCWFTWQHFDLSLSLEVL